MGAAIYPVVAGYKEFTTSKENAEHIETTGRAKTLRDRVRALVSTPIGNDGGGNLFSQLTV